tara:strand:+ start:4311 stop:4736 length:426 start_codon:yes stop_codon:yes gene_type:complete
VDKFININLYDIEDMHKATRYLGSAVLAYGAFLASSSNAIAQKNVSQTASIPYVSQLEKGVSPSFSISLGYLERCCSMYQSKKSAEDSLSSKILYFSEHLLIILSKVSGWSVLCGVSSIRYGFELTYKNIIIVEVLFNKNI